MKITVITVAYNAEETIEDTLRSVAQQTHPLIEHIVIDGGSTDATTRIIEAYKSGLAYFVSEPDQGIYDAMNKGLDLATGDVIGFLNSDDVYSNRNIVSAVAQIHKNAGLDACYADLVYVNDLQDSTIQRRWRSKDYEKGLCFKGWMPAHPTLYLKKRVFDNVGRFRVDLGNQADLEFCARAFELENISSLYKREVWVTMRTGGASQSGIRSMIKSNWKSYLALKELGLKRDPLSYFLLKFGSKLPQFFARS